MTRTFIELPLFRSKWKDLGLDDSDLRRLQEEILADPKIGSVMFASLWRLIAERRCFFYGKF